jgi:hypothetical protein
MALPDSGRQDPSSNEFVDSLQKDLEKQDLLDLDSLTYSDSVPAKADSTRSRGRAPASVDEVPLPETLDLKSEIESASRTEVVPVSSKERKAMVLQTIADNYSELNTCYRDGLKKSSEMKGKVVLGWNMDTQGRVSGVEVLTSQLNNKQVEKCMADRLSEWRFPRQAKRQGNKDRMTYAFQFVSEKE